MVDLSKDLMEHVMYLYAIIDVYNRCILGRGLYSTLDASPMPLMPWRGHKGPHGAPEIINSDQGRQYAGNEWLDACSSHEIKVSIDCRSAARNRGLH